MTAFAKYYDYMRSIDSASYPVWPLGVQVMPGDFGLLSRQKGGGFWRYVFVREGSLSTYLDPAVLAFETVSSPLKWKKTSGVRLHANADAKINEDIPVKFNGTLTAEAGVAVLVDFETGQTHRLKDNHIAYQAYGKIDMSYEKRVMVTSVTSTSRGVAVVSESDGWKVNVSGDAKAVSSLHLADASVALSGEGAETDVFRVKHATPVTLRVAGRNFFGQMGLSGGDGGKDTGEIGELHPDLLP